MQASVGATSCAAGRPDSDRAFTATLLPGGSRVVNGPIVRPPPPCAGWSTGRRAVPLADRTATVLSRQPCRPEGRLAILTEGHYDA